MLSSKNILFDDYNYESPRYLSKEEFDLENKRTDISDGDVLLTIVGTVGRTCCVKNPFIPFTLQRSVAVIKPKRDVISSRFLMYVLHSLSDLWNNEAKGAAQKGVYLKQLAVIPIPTPSLSEQERIVERLDAAFAQIDELKNNAERQLAEARALFQSALTQAMQPKPGWQEKTLGDITTSMADGPFGSNLKKEHYTDIPEVRIIQLSNIGEDGWREENTKYTTFNHLQTIQRSEVFPGDIVIAKMMPAGRAILCPSHETKFVLSSDAVRATLKDGLNRRFVLYSINSPYFRKQVYENVSGSGRVRTSLTKLRACNLFIPNKDVQDKVVKLLDSLYENIRLLEELHHKTVAECDALKQALLRQIFE